MTPAEFSFPISNLDAGGQEFRLPVRSAWLRGVLEGTAVTAPDKDGELDVRLSKSGVDVVIRGTLAADLVVPCSRCLDPAPVAIREDISILAVPASQARGGRDRHGESEDDEAEEDAGEADVIAYEGETIVLDDLVRDELLLGIPMIPLCSEACPGIRPERQTSDATSAADESIDPRLRPLLRLKNKT